MAHLWEGKQRIAPGIECFKLLHEGRTICRNPLRIFIESAQH